MVYAGLVRRRSILPVLPEIGRASCRESVDVAVFSVAFSSRRRHTRSLCDWSSDVCSSDLNGEPIHVSKISTLGESLLGTGFPSKKRHLNPNIHYYHQLTLKSHGVRRPGSAALDLACVA